jgi:hypothetical protein
VLALNTYYYHAMQEGAMQGEIALGDERPQDAANTTESSSPAVDPTVATNGIARYVAEPYAICHAA